MSTLQKATHPLFLRPIQTIRNWAEWHKRWEFAISVEEMLGLLHMGFSVPAPSYVHQEAFNDVSRLSFYFSVADNWEEDFYIPTDNRAKEYQLGFDKHGYPAKKSVGELRQVVARKAFDMLCSNFFNMGLYKNGEDFGWMWKSVVFSRELFPVIKDFFRMENRYSFAHSVRNLSVGLERSHGEQQAIAFLLNLAKFMWEWKEPKPPQFDVRTEEKRKEDTELRIRIDESKPWMVEVLSTIGRLDLLREWILELDGVCLAKLREIALRVELYTPKARRPVETLEEACLADSRAAWFLKEWELKTEETKRLQAICDAQNAKDEAERTLKKLNAK